MVTVIGHNAVLKMGDGTFGQRRSLLPRHGAVRKLGLGKSLLFARLEMAYHPFHHFLLNRIEQAILACAWKDLRHRQRNETFGRVMPETCAVEQMLEGIGMTITLRQEVGQIEKLLYGGEHRGVLVHR